MTASERTGDLLATRQTLLDAGLVDDHGRRWVCAPALGLDTPEFEPLADGALWLLDQERSRRGDATHSLRLIELAQLLAGDSTSARSPLTQDEQLPLLPQARRLPAPTATSARLVLVGSMEPCAAVLVTPLDKRWQRYGIPFALLRSGEVLLPFPEGGPEPIGYLRPAVLATGAETPPVTPDRLRRAVGHRLGARAGDGFEVEVALREVRPGARHGSFEVSVIMTGEVGPNPAGPGPNPWADDGFGLRTKDVSFSWTAADGDPRSWLVAKIAETPMRQGSTNSEW